MMNLPFDEKQIALIEAAARVAESFSDDGTAHDYLIVQCVEGGFLVKTKRRKTPYEFTQAGCIAVVLWGVVHRPAGN